MEEKIDYEELIDKAVEDVYTIKIKDEEDLKYKDLL